MSDHLPGEDPGWKIDRRTIIGMLIPGSAVQRGASATNLYASLLDTTTE